MIRTCADLTCNVTLEMSILSMSDCCCCDQQHLDIERASKIIQKSQKQLSMTSFYSNTGCWHLKEANDNSEEINIEVSINANGIVLISSAIRNVNGEVIHFFVLILQYKDSRIILFFSCKAAVWSTIVRGIHARGDSIISESRGKHCKNHVRTLTDSMKRFLLFGTSMMPVSYIHYIRV